MRCVLHASLYDQNCFVTLTYDEKKANYHNNFNYPDIQKFKKRLRAFCWRKLNKRVQVFNVHEYGKQGKKHWHLVIFNHDFPDKKFHTVSNGNNLYTSKRLSGLWKHGFNTIGDVTEASAMYQAQYTQKDLKNGNATNKKKSHSKHSGIGKEYFLQHYDQLLTLGYVPFAGRKAPLPRYFQKLAHKHWCHYYQQSAFHDIFQGRKKLYTAFKTGEPNKKIADLFQIFLQIKKIKLDELVSDWDDYIEQNLFSKETPDFMKSAQNYIHDLKNKQHLKEF